MAVIGFIGMGNMGYALLKGLLKERRMRPGAGYTPRRA